ncbi:MAG: hypothetical protein IJH14_09170 [Solobacterium sp.]|nr:hypothetical protein [Solobacterium sp.]
MSLLLEGMSRGAGKDLFFSMKSDLASDILDTVNDGEGAEVENPDSKEIPYKGNWESSEGFVCDGEVAC